jgi:hypothetical protein
MANKGVRGFYLITQTIKDTLLADINVNTVTTGDLTEIDLSKQTIFPLSHLIVNTITVQEQVLNISLTLLSMDIVDVNKDEVIDIFVGNNNEQDILNTQLAVQNKLFGKLRQGTLYDDNYQLVGDPSCEPFYDRFENELAGWSASFNVQIPNDIYLC